MLDETVPDAADLSAARRGSATAIRADVLEAMSDGFFAYDADWRCVWLNGAARRQLAEGGIDPERLTGRVVWEAIPGLEGGAFHDHLLRCARDRIATRFEAPGPVSGRWVEATAIPVAGGVTVFTRETSERRRAAVRERLLVEAGALLSEPLDLQQTLRAMAAMAIRAFCDVCVTYVEADMNSGSAAAEVIEPEEPSPVPLETLRMLLIEPAPGSGAAAGARQVLRTGPSMLLHGEALHERLGGAGAEGEAHGPTTSLSSALIVPLTARGRTFGAAAFLRHRSGPADRFDHDDVGTAEELGRRTAMAIDNGRLLEAERSARARAERLQDLATALSAARTFSDVAEAVLTEGMALVGASGGRVIAPPEPGDRLLRVVNGRGWSESEQGPLEPIPIDARVPSAEAVATGRIVWVRQNEMPTRYPDHAPIAERGGHRTWIAVPFLHEGRVLGAFGLALPDDRPASGDMLALLRTMAHQCTQAMERIRLYEAAESARLEAERERADLTAVLEVTPIGIGIARDADCTEIRVNPALATHLGIDPGTNASSTGPRAATLPFRVFSNGREVPPLELPMQRAAREGRTTDAQLEVVHPDGRRLQLLEYAAPLLDEHGRPRGAVGAFVDVTDRARLLEAEREARLEAEAARTAAESANQAKSDFLAIMSHELRTPLNAIAGYVELLEMGIRGPVTPEQRAALGRIRAAQRTLLRRIDDVLSFAKLEAGQVDFELGEVRIADLLAGVEPLVLPQVRERGIRYRSAPCDPSLLAHGDGEKAGQVLLNLVANAVKFTPKGGDVTVSAQHVAGEVIISVSDTGVGIPQRKIDSIFDPFVQVDTRLTREHGGTGLGLAISRDLMVGMGGELSVESVEGEGSTFRMILPAVAG